MFLFLFCVWRFGSAFPWGFLSVIEAIITLEWMQNKSLMSNSTLFFFLLPAVGLSASAHELELCAVLSRSPYFISTLWLHADHIHVEFCSRRDLISPPLSQECGREQRLSYLCIVVSVYLTAAGFLTMRVVPCVPLIFHSFVNETCFPFNATKWKME